MKVAILYIATGRYMLFWDEFYKSAHKHFLPNAKKNFIVFSDNPQLGSLKNPDVKFFPIERKGFPFDTLLRFEIFLQAEELLKDCDYVFYFNANILFNSPVLESDILPNESQEGLVCANHPIISRYNKDAYPYERNPSSLAYIKDGDGYAYVQGALIGGTSDAFIRMSKILAENIRRDLQKNIVAIWHDESHLNRYILDKTPKLLPIEFLCPNTRKYRNRCKSEIKILLLEKEHPQYGGTDFIRGKTDKPNNSLWQRLKWAIKLK